MRRRAGGLAADVEGEGRVGVYLWAWKVRGGHRVDMDMEGAGRVGGPSSCIPKNFNFLNSAKNNFNLAFSCECAFYNVYR